MEVGFWVDNSGIKDLDFQNIRKGNPGCGGTEYLFILLISLLSNNNKFKLTVFSTHPIKGVNGYVWKKSQSLEDAILSFDDSAQGGAFVIVAFDIDKIVNLHIKNTRVIMWHHNSLDRKKSKLVATANFKINHVFLSKYQQRDYLRYPKIISKGTIINNANVSDYCLIKRDFNCNNVVFLGSIVPNKNLDLLIKAWPKVISNIKAELFVIGSGKVYSRETKLGPKGIAEPSYESYLFSLMSNPNVLDSIHFLGIMSNEQFADKIAPITKVGVVNPGFNPKYYGETFCLSATQFGSLGIPVIGGDLYGLKSTIPNKCGFRIRSIDDLAKKIVKLLENNSINYKYGKKYQAYIKNNFDVSFFENKWTELLTENNVRYCKYFFLIPYIFGRIITFPFRHLKYR